jgi:hypothetical protein
VTQPREAEQALPPPREWFWRIVGALMLLMLGWLGWVAYQLMPSSLATPAAYQALAQARAARNVQEGHIKPAPQPAAAQAPRKAPVDTEKLRLSDSIETPIPEK